MYFAEFDDAGKITAFYNDKINHTIPQSAIQITDEQWQIVSNNSERWLVENGQLVLIPETQPQAEPINILNWGSFNRDMQTDAAYHQFIINATDKESVRRLESLAISLGVSNSQNSNIDDMNFLWNVVLASIPLENRPTTSVVNTWNLIAKNSYMPFIFVEDGFMEQLPE